MEDRRFKTLRERVQWWWNDAAYKAPEQLNAAYVLRLLEDLRDADEPCAECGRIYDPQVVICERCAMRFGVRWEGRGSVDGPPVIDLQIEEGEHG